MTDLKIIEAKTLADIPDGRQYIVWQDGTAEEAEAAVRRIGYEPTGTVYHYRNYWYFEASERRRE